MSINILSPYLSEARLDVQVIFFRLSGLDLLIRLELSFWQITLSSDQRHCWDLIESQYLEENTENFYLLRWHYPPREEKSYYDDKSLGKEWRV